MYQVNVNFSRVKPLLQELEEIKELCENTKFCFFTETDILYFATTSKTANYDFLIDKIDHAKKTVLLLAA